MFENKKVILLCGRAQSGKSTAAGLLQDMGWSPMAFADPLKKMLHEGLLVPNKYLYGTNEEKNEPLDCLCGKSARYAMQTLGSEWRDLIGKDLWLKQAEWNLLLNPSIKIVIEDLRFQHEYDWAMSHGFTVIGVERPGQGTSNATHQSETWDFKSTGMPVIQNDGTLQDLEHKLRSFL